MDLLPSNGASFFVPGLLMLDVLGHYMDAYCLQYGGGASVCAGTRGLWYLTILRTRAILAHCKNIIIVSGTGGSFLNRDRGQDRCRYVLFASHYVSESGSYIVSFAGVPSRA